MTRTSVHIERSTGPDALADQVARAFVQVVGDAQAAGRVAEVVLTGGTIADVVHRRIAELADDSGIDWAAVQWWWGDERFVDEDSPDRNAGQARAALLDHVDVAEFRVREMPTPQDATLPAAAAVYADELAAGLGARSFDLVMLGVGPDAHIASLFPGHAALSAQGATVAVSDSPKPPPERISMTVPRLLNAERIWVLASGESKRPAVEALLDPTDRAPSTTQAPVRALLPHPQLTLWTDLPR